MLVRERDVDPGGLDHRLGQVRIVNVRKCSRNGELGGGIHRSEYRRKKTGAGGSAGSPRRTTPSGTSAD